jgi:hypothetical protein
MTQDGSKEDRQTMSRKTYKTIETPSGSGELRKAGAHLAKVFYHLQVRQETIVGELAAGQEDRPGRLDIAGEVTVSQDEPMQAQVLKGMNSGDLLTLYLADGRRLDVYATKGDAFSDAYRIVPGGPAGLISEQQN